MSLGNVECGPGRTEPSGGWRLARPWKSKACFLVTFTLEPLQGHCCTMSTRHSCCQLTEQLLMFCHICFFVFSLSVRVCVCVIICSHSIRVRIPTVLFGAVSTLQTSGLSPIMLHQVSQEQNVLFQGHHLVIKYLISQFITYVTVIQNYFSD